MQTNGLTVIYENGINTVCGNQNADYPAGDLLCRIFQGESLDSIGRIFRNIVNAYPMQNSAFNQDEVEEAERYILNALLYEEFFPARRLAQGSFIRIAEHLRSHDSEAQDRILPLEKQRVADYNLLFYDGRLFYDIGFDTVGSFLRLCFNNYYIDLKNAKDLFETSAAIRSHTDTEAERTYFDDLCEDLSNEENIPPILMKTVYDRENRAFRTHYIINSFTTLAVFELSHLDETGIKIMRCQNPKCRKFFTARRSSAKYCGFPAPQSPGKTCKEYLPMISHHKKKQEEEIDRLIGRAENRLCQAAHREKTPVRKEEIRKMRRDMLNNAALKKPELLKGTLTIAEFREWLDSHTHKRKDDDHE